MYFPLERDKYRSRRSSDNSTGILTLVGTPPLPCHTPLSFVAPNWSMMPSRIIGGLSPPRPGILPLRIPTVLFTFALSTFPRSSLHPKRLLFGPAPGLPTRDRLATSRQAPIINPIPTRRSILVLGLCLFRFNATCQRHISRYVSQPKSF